MKTSPFIIAFLGLFISQVALAQPGCSPATTNGTCPTAVALVVDAPCVNGTTCSGGAQAGSTCLYAGSECSWYSFVATATDMFVNIEVTANSGCHISSNVYEATGACVGTEVSCQSGAPLDDLHSLTGLSIGTTYYVQVCYSPGGPCGNSGSADYCISVGEPDPPCDQCSTPCGTASGFATPPAIQDVTDNCLTSPFSPELQPSSTNTFCYNFDATATSVDFNVIITSNCGAGNVTNFSWDLYNSPSCGSPIQSGTLASLTFSGLTIGNSYVFCYTFDVPSTCTHSQHCPYFVGATVPLPITLSEFNAEVVDAKVILNWNTISEQNNDYFSIEKTTDGKTFELVGKVDGNGNSDNLTSYELEDRYPFRGTSYYRLKQTDFNGQFKYSNLVSVHLTSGFERMAIVPNPVSGAGQLNFDSGSSGRMDIYIIDLAGKCLLVDEGLHYSVGRNSFKLSTKELKSGVYFLQIQSGEISKRMRFIKN